MADNLQSSLTRILQSVRSATAASSENLRTYADQNNSNVQRILKDIHRVFTSNARQNANINSSIEESVSETQRFSSKMDGTNNLLQQTLSIQSVMLSELKALNGSMRSLISASFNNRGGLFGGGMGGLSGAAAAALGAGGAAWWLANRGNQGGGNNNNLPPAVERSGGGGSGARPSSREIYDYLVGKGLDHNKAVGMLANVARETGGTFDAGLVNPDDNGDGPSGGLFQHHDSRRDGSRRFTNMKAAVGENWKQNWKGQVDFALSEPDGQRYLAANYASPEEATAAFYRKFERGANESSDLAKSQTWLDKWAREGFGRQTQRQETNPPAVPPAPQPERSQEQPAPQPQQERRTPERTTQTRTSAQIPGRQPQQTPPGAPRSPTPQQEGGDAQRLAAYNLRPEFAEKIGKLIAAAEQATGERVRIVQGYRDPHEQAQYYADYIGKEITYDGQTYKPNPARKGIIAAPPGQSKHQFGLAVDVSAGKARDWMAQHAGEFGITWGGNWRHSDPPHFQMEGGGQESTLQPNRTQQPSRTAEMQPTPASPRPDIINRQASMPQPQYGPDPNDPSRSIPLNPDQQSAAPMQTAAFNPAIDGNLFGTALYNPMAARFSWPLQVLAEYGGRMLRA